MRALGRVGMLTIATLTLGAPGAHAVELLEDEPPEVVATPPDEGAEQVIGVPLRLGIFGGWHATAADLDVLGDRVEGNEPDAGPAFGVRLGWRVVEGLGLELTAGAIPAGSEWLVPVVAEARWRPLEAGGITPTAGLGAGCYAGFGAGGDVDLLLSASAGLEIALGRGVALRVEVAVWATDGVEGALAFSPVATVGVDLFAFRVHRRAPADEPPAPRPTPRGCPRGAAVEACVDTDQDGIIDVFDRCPVEPGTFEGCADADGDQVPGPVDACPARAGRRVDWGCPRGR